MEIFVDEEIQLQLANNRNLSLSANDLNLVEVATFALNRLPSLYASSQEGIQKQKAKGMVQLKPKVKQAVAQGFAAVVRDPLRKSTPLPSEKTDTILDAKKTLTNLNDSFPKEELATLVDFMESFLQKVKREEITEQEVIKLFYLLDYYGDENGDGLFFSNKKVIWVD
ncbi:late competence development ComFB family protein [Geminocystis sp. NIES-3709]|uniref:late competence development ComFB family protein n=1 Tax=Geminocystis sp. NIES-3709 TaxID=1617448 RepID=UPI000AA9EC3D|nr:late competence development ComFB family protein [Geminocystis sp. NIES-3709]